jgi:hypothetical protein
MMELATLTGFWIWDPEMSPTPIELRVWAIQGYDVPHYLTCLVNFPHVPHYLSAQSRRTFSEHMSGQFSFCVSEYTS